MRTTFVLLTALYSVTFYIFGWSPPELDPLLGIMVMLMSLMMASTIAKFRIPFILLPLTPVAAYCYANIRTPLSDPATIESLRYGVVLVLFITALSYVMRIGTPEEDATELRKPRIYVEHVPDGQFDGKQGYYRAYLEGDVFGTTPFASPEAAISDLLTTLLRVQRPYKRSDYEIVHYTATQEQP